MTVQITLPRVSVAHQESKILTWFKKEGDEVKAGEPLLEAETEKVTVEIQAQTSGVIKTILAPAGSTVPVMAPLAEITLPGEEQPIADATEAREEPDKPGWDDDSHPSPADKHADIQGVVRQRQENVRPKSRRISPAARALAAEHGIDIGTLQGTGPGGKIQRRDVERAIAEVKSRPEILTQLGLTGRRIEYSNIRRIIAERMTLSSSTKPQVTITSEATVTEMMSIRNEMSGRNLQPLSHTSFVVKAVAEALAIHQEMNSMILGEDWYLIDDINIGVAIAVPEGTIVPVLRHANQKTLSEIDSWITVTAQKAKSGRLSPEETSGSTFTVSSLGMSPVYFFTPIVNPPETGILGVGRVFERILLDGGRVISRAFMPLSLTFDHRVMDGASAGMFLETVVSLLEKATLSLGSGLQRT